jgi:hypothetical protein
MMTKSQLAKFVAAGLGRESFSHTHCGSFDITAMRMKAQAENRNTYTSDINDDLITFLLTKRDVCPFRVAEITVQQLDDPAMIIHLKDGFDLLCDGTHRIFAAYTRFNRKEFSFWMFQEEEAITVNPEIWHSPDEVKWGAFDIIDGKVIPNG